MNLNTDYQALAHHFVYYDDAAHCYGHRMYCSNNVLYSYGSHFIIAKKIKLKDGRTVFLFNTSSASVTTSKQQRCTEQALYSHTVFNVHIPSYSNEISYIKFVKDYFNSISDQLELMDKARTKANDYQWEAIRILNELKLFIETFKPKYRFSKLEKEILNQETLTTDQVNTAIKKRKQLDTQTKRRKNKRAVLKEEENIKLWLNNELGHIYTNYTSDVYLRLSKDGERVETSKSSNVSVKAAKVLYLLIQSGKDVKGHNIDGFTVIGLNGGLKIGCHEITKEEINRFANLMNW